jgi:hypothetical protein
MGIALRYWRLVRLDVSGKRKIEEHPAAKAFFKAQFLDGDSGIDVDDSVIQQQLWAIIHSQPTVHSKSTAPASNPLISADSTLAELCLRCFISNQIEQVCIQLESQFGLNHGFNRYDLFPFVLDDVIPIQLDAKSAKSASPFRYCSSQTTLAAEILKTFNPMQSSLANWTNRLVKHHRDLNRFLLENGVYLTSDWAILNDTSLTQLNRILIHYYQASPLEVQQASELLNSYHAVYRRDRLQQRQTGYRGQCHPPTPQQLTEMKQCLQTSSLPGFQAGLKEKSIHSQLQYLAQRLRQYRILARGGKPTSESLDLHKNLHALEQRLADAAASPLAGNDDQQDFLEHYRHHLVKGLDQAIIQVCQNRLQLLQKRDRQAAETFLLGLHLFHCQGKSMAEMAPLLSLNAQYQVSRLLKLKEFRAAVCQQLLHDLKNTTLPLAAQYANPRLLSQLGQQVETALTEQINNISATATAEASVPRNRPTASLFARRLCHVLARQDWQKRTTHLQACHSQGGCT